MDLSFFQLDPIPDNAMSGYYDYKLVLLSYIIAVLASLVALEISQGIRQSKNSIFLPLLGGAFAMGAGIFSMHFVGMLAFIMPMPTSYDFFWTFLSMIIAIVASGFAFYVVRSPQDQLKYRQIIGGGLILGIAIASMHYTGMAAMIGMHNSYLPGLFALSIFVAISASMAALYLMMECEKGSIIRQRIVKTASALVMGAGISGMHFIGMEASVMTPTIIDSMETSIPILSPERLSFLIAFAASSIMIIALLLTGYRHLILVKMLIGFMITPLLLTPLIVILLQNMQEVNQWGNVVSNELIPPVYHLIEMENDFLDTSDFIPYLAIPYSLEKWLRNKERLIAILEKMGTDEKKYLQQKQKQQKIGFIKREELKALEDKLLLSITALIELMEKKAPIEAINYQHNELKYVESSLERLIHRAILNEFFLLSKWNSENKPYHVETGFIYISIVCLVFLFSIIACILIALDTTIPLKKAVSIIKKLTKGDLDFKIDVYSKNETGQLLEAMKLLALSQKKMSDALTAVSRGDLTIAIESRSDKDSLGLALLCMIDNLRNINGDIQDEVKNLTLSSHEIVNSVSQVAKSSKNTADAILQTKTSVEELKQIALVTDEKANEVLNNSQNTVDIVITSEHLLQATMHDMRKISEKMRIISESIVKLSEHSQTIGEIIDSVNDLAEQSNLLAVNAAIEAAMAGEHGKSFAVVAKEIRILAEQSKAATKQVRSLLNEIQNATAVAVLATEQGSKVVDNGVKQSAQTNESMQVLSKSITLVTKAADQIAISSQQQFIGIEQVTVAMDNISTATTHLVNHMKSIESAASSLKSVGSSLKEMTDHYIMEKKDSIYTEVPFEDIQ